jgi:hypothetical protein
MFDRFSQLWRRRLFHMRRGRFDRELEEEMRFHLEMKAEENLAAGLRMMVRNPGFTAVSVLTLTLGNGC